MLSFLAPPERITLSEWSDKYRVLPAESSPEPGRWRNSRVEYMRYIQDCLTNPEVEQVTLMSSVQIAKTETQFNTLFYFADRNAGPMMALFSTQAMAEDYSKTRLSPSADLMPQVREKLGTPKSRSSNNTISLKKWRGGYLKLTGANSPTEVSGKPIKILLCDEVDRYKEHALEGDVFDRAKDRTTAFPHDKKIFVTSTPTTKGFSIVAEEFEKGEKHFFHIPCPHCGHLHRLLFAHVGWKGKNPETAWFSCPECKGRFGDFEKNKAVQKGRWFLAEPLKETRQRRHFSFHISALYSPWKSLADIVKTYLEINGNAKKEMGFVNTILGEVYEESKIEIKENDFVDRLEHYGAEVPEGALILTSGADTQPDRIEAELVGWGAGEESWSLDYQVFFGNTDVKEGLPGSPWDAYTAWRRKVRTNAKGVEFVVHHSCIDSGGENTQAVYQYVKSHQGEGLYAIKGVGGEDRPYVGGPSRKRSGKRGMRPVDVYPVGVDSVKSVIMGRLGIKDDEGLYQKRGPGVCHFPIGRDEDYFKQLLAERKRTKIDKRGRLKAEWVVIQGRRNEALDCRVYAYAALVLANPAFDKLALWVKRRIYHLKKEEEAVKVEEPTPESQPGAVEKEKPKRKVKVIRRVSRPPQW